MYNRAVRDTRAEKAASMRAEKRSGAFQRLAALVTENSDFLSSLQLDTSRLRDTRKRELSAEGEKQVQDTQRSLDESINGLREEYVRLSAEERELLGKLIEDRIATLEALRPADEKTADPDGKKVARRLRDVYYFARLLGRE